MISKSAHSMPLALHSRVCSSAFATAVRGEVAGAAEEADPGDEAEGRRASPPQTAERIPVVMAMAITGAHGVTLSG